MTIWNPGHVVIRESYTSAKYGVRAELVELLTCSIVRQIDTDAGMLIERQQGTDEACKASYDAIVQSIKNLEMAE